jgi:hypothetical protein
MVSDFTEANAYLREVRCLEDFIGDPRNCGVEGSVDAECCDQLRVQRDLARTQASLHLSKASFPPCPFNADGTYREHRAGRHRGP